MQRMLGCCAQVTAWDAGGNWLDQGKILDRPPLFWHGHKTFPVGLNFQVARQLYRKKSFHWIENHFSGKINTCYPCVRTGMRSRDLQGKRDRPEKLLSSTQAVPSWGTWRGTFLYAAFNSMDCICGYFSTLSTTSAET